MILTVTINPAIDRNVTADRLVFEDRAYILASSESAGGRGINAARVIAAFGAEVLALMTSGGETGKCMEAFLRKEGLPFEAVPIANPVRTNLSISDRQGLTIKLNESGPELNAQEAERLERAVADHLKEARWLLLCGSLPPGVPDNFYARLVRKARARNVQVLLDTDGEALRKGIEAKPAIVCPSQQEAEQLLDAVLLTRAQIVDAVERIRAMGSDSVLLSMGSKGAMLACDKGIFEIAAPEVDAVCPIGAGDAQAAAYAWAMNRGESMQEAARWGVACGTASVVLPGVSFPTLASTEELLARVEIRKVQ